MGIEKGMQKVILQIGEEHTQDEIADFFGVSRKTINQWANGTRPVRISDSVEKGMNHYGYYLKIFKGASK